MTSMVPSTWIRYSFIVFRYFSCGWVKEVYYHPISTRSRLCFLSTKVTPSMATSKSPYQVWVCVTKDTAEEPGGMIHTAYCTCTAGYEIIIFYIYSKLKQQPFAFTRKCLNIWVYYVCLYFSLHGACNHIAGCLFKVEHSVRSGMPYDIYPFFTICICLMTTAYSK